LHHFEKSLRNGETIMNNSSDLTGKVLGTCTLIQLIGRGGMGAVYLAQQTRPVRRVAVKVLLPDLLKSGDVDTGFHARFQREANLIAQLEHINIVPIYEFGEQDGLTYLVMPYLTGGSLRDVLARRGKLSLYETIAYIEQAAAALDYAHAHSIVHRDLKPANFLLHADGRLVLADFGIARMMQDDNRIAASTLTGTGIFLGTPEYMAPEMIRGENIDHRADIYELGIVLFEMLSGTVPYKGNTAIVVATKHLQEPMPSLHAMNSDLPQSVDTIMQLATAKRPGDRFMSAGALAQSLRLSTNPQNVAMVGDEQNIATVMSSPRPVASPVIARQVINTDPANVRSEPKSGEFSPRLTTYPVTPPGIQGSPPASRQPILLFIGILLVLVLVLGGILLGLQLNRGGTNLSTRSTTTPVEGATTPSVGIQTPIVPDPNEDPQGFYTWATSGHPAVTESFLGTSTLNWETNGSCTLSNDGFHVSGTPALFNVCFAKGKSYGNFVFQANMSISNGQGGGLSFRGDGQEQYNFFVNADGTYLLAFGNENADRPLFQKSSSIFIQQSDTLTAIARGSDIYLYVNQHFLTHITDTFSQSGEIGLLAAAASTVVFINLKVWEL
jgi:serine/threonine protein kinase